MNIFKFSLNIGGGAEWNLAGSTSLVFGLNWYNGFSNVLKNDSKYVFRTYSNGYAATKQNAKASAIALTVGVLF
jgi:enterochelin esterase-like enzyme